MLHRALVGVALSGLALAQSVTVDCPDSTIGAMAGQYPIYTGAGTAVIRGQSFCAGSFAGLPTTPMLCTRIGIQLGENPPGAVTYAQFVVRAGSTTLTALTSAWATNLPDQRVQVDLSNTPIAGGPGVNQWVEWQLAYPFYYNPGDGVVVDFTTQAGIAGTYLRTALGTGVPRCVTTNYTGGPTGAAYTSGGIKFRMVFEPLGMVTIGSGCPGAGNQVPQLGVMGQSNLGSQNLIVTLNNALGGALCAFLLGNPLELDIGGGCRLYNDALFNSFQLAAGTGTGGGSSAFFVPIPNAPGLLGFVANVQWAVFDPLSSAWVPVVTTAGGKLVVY